MEKISWSNRVGNEEVLHRVKEKKTILHTLKRKNGNWIGHRDRKRDISAGKTRKKT